MEHMAVIGAGTMGSGIAQVFLQAGFPVTLIDQSGDQLVAAHDRIEQGLEKMAEKEAIDEEPDSLMSHLDTSTRMADVEDADLIIEAVPETIEAKKEVYGEATDHNDTAIYASNTSSIPITTLADHAPDRGRFVGMHFFNPAPVMDVVEVIKTKDTEKQVMEHVLSLVYDIGKEYSVVKDAPGFVSNRILMPMLNEAIRTYEEGIASLEDIDKIARKGFNHPMGPLELADYIGLDVCLDIMERIYENTGKDRFEPAELLREKVEAGDIGRKSGEGFYEYD